MKTKKAPRNGNGALAKAEEPLADWIPYLKNLDILSYYQKQISENLRGAFWFGDAWQSWLQLAPTNLMQDIMRNWSFSLVQFTNQIRGNPETETKIIKGVAGYGSQLGTIMDFLEVMAKKVDLKDLEDVEDRFKVFRFVDLLDKINRTKGRPETSSLKSLLNP